MWWSFLRSLSLCALLALPAVDAVAQVGGASLLFKVIDPVPRSRALGEVGVVLRGEPGIGDLNPAAISSPGQVQVRGGGGDWLPALGAGMRLNGLSVAYGQKRWTVAYQYKHLDLGDHEQRNASNEVLGTFKSYDVAHEMTGAYDLTPHLRGGLGLNYIYSERVGVARVDAAGPASVRTVTLDLGLHYERAWEGGDVSVKPMAGWSLTDIGGKVEYVEGEEKPMATMMRGGVGVEVGVWRRWLDRPLIGVGLYGGAAKMIVARDSNTVHHSLGALVHTWRPIEMDYSPQSPGDEQQLSVWDQLMWSSGVELSWLGIVSMRWGHFEEHKYNGARNFDTFGRGVDLYYVAVGVAEIVGIEPRHPLASTRVTTFTVRVPIGGEAEGNFWPELIDLLGW